MPAAMKSWAEGSGEIANSASPAIEPVAIALGGFAQRVEILDALRGQASAAGPRPECQGEASGGRRRGADEHERHRCDVEVELEDDEHGPRRRAERRQQVDGEDDAGDDQ